ncbi:MAG: hypothetical protein U1E89_10055 [Burkholderiaceae bacterium]
MNNSFARLIDGMCHQLEHEVLPGVADDYARSQLWGVINALNTFRARADWSSPLLVQQIGAQQQALAAVAPLLPGTEVPPPPGTVPSTADLMALRERGSRAIAECLRRLADPATAPSAGAATQAESLLRTAMRAEVDLELKYSPRPLFAKMSGEAG